MKTLTNLTTLFGLAALALACNKAPERGPETARNSSAVDKRVDNMTPASGTRSAAEQIAHARCQREQQCGNIGNDKAYSSSQDCTARIQNNWKDDLNARECPGGINQHQLDECMAQIRAEACSSPFDTLARITECTTAQICVD